MLPVARRSVAGSPWKCCRGVVVPASGARGPPRGCRSVAGSPWKCCRGAGIRGEGTAEGLPKCCGKPVEVLRVARGSVVEGLLYRHPGRGDRRGVAEVLRVARRRVVDGVRAGSGQPEPAKV